MPFLKIDEEQKRTGNVGADIQEDDACQDDEVYDKVCSNLLTNWADGIIRIEVLDGERFNTDVFLGSTSILLSSFCVAPQRSKEQGSVREISGSFALEKAHITDRVSGSLFVHAYLHWPEKALLKELMSNAPMASGSAVSSNANSASENTHVKEDTSSSSSPPRLPSPSTPSSSSMCSNPAPTRVLKLLAKHKSNWGAAGVRRSRIRLVGESPESSEPQQKASPPTSSEVRNNHQVPPIPSPSPTTFLSVGGSGSGGGSGSRMSRLADLEKLITGLDSVALDAELVLESYQEKLEGASSAKKLVQCTSPITTNDN